MIRNKLIKGIYLIKRKDQKDQDKPHYYIGQSVDIFKRWNQHCDENSQFIDKAIQEYGFTEFEFSIIEEVSNESELNEREKYWINFYKKKVGESQLYNISETKNANPHVLNAVTKNEIKKLFIDDIGRSIYAISEKYSIAWEEVMKIRKPLLTKYGLKYDTRLKNIVFKETGTIPENWRGRNMTKSISDKILALKKVDKGRKDIANECNISTTDLDYFIEEYEEKGLSYDYALTL